MSDRVSSAKSSRSRPEEKARPASKPKVHILYPRGAREISRDLYYPTDRYRLSQPLFPNHDSLKVSEPS